MAARSVLKGKGFGLNDFVNNLPIEFHQFAEKGEYVPGGSFNDQQKYSFCGPGTRYEQRVREGYKGINELDSICKLHDQFYNEFKDTHSRNFSDKALADRAKIIAVKAAKNNDLTLQKDADFLSKIMATKAALGLGINMIKGIGITMGRGKDSDSNKSSNTSSNKNSAKSSGIDPETKNHTKPTTKKRTSEWSEKLSEELHKPVKRKFQRRHVLVNEVDDIWSCDLVEMQEWSKNNKNFRYMLNVVDCFSKYAWSVPLKDKTAKTVLDAFKKIVKQSSRIPKHLWVDEGKEFYNKELTAWLKENNIVRYSTYGEHKSSICERFNRTLKTNMWKRFTAENTRNWVDMLDKLLSDYNNHRHSSIKMKPIDAVLKENQPLVFNNLQSTMKIPKVSHPIANTSLTSGESKSPTSAESKSPTSSSLPLPTTRSPVEPPSLISKFKVGDKVRISRIKGIFEKGFLPNWSEELFEVHKIKRSIPVTYILKDTNNEVISGSFYNEELQKSDQETFRIEKILRKKKIDGVMHGFVKWIGYNHSFNQWIPIKDIFAT